MMSGCGPECGTRVVEQQNRPRDVTRRHAGDVESASKATFFYGPGYLAWIVPGWLLGDVRIANLAAEILVFVARLRLRRAPGQPVTPAEPPMDRADLAHVSSWPVHAGAGVGGRFC